MWRGLGPLEHVDTCEGVASCVNDADGGKSDDDDGADGGKSDDDDDGADHCDRARGDAAG